MKRLWLLATIAMHVACTTSDGISVFGDADSDESDSDDSAPPGKTGKAPGTGDVESTAEQTSPLAGQLSLPKIMTLAKQAGLPCDRLVMAGAVAMAESEGWTDSVNVNGSSSDCPYGSRDRGVWQINDCYWPAWDDDCAFDPACNASAMATISDNGESFSLWSSVIPDGTYVNWLEDAEAALSDVPGCGGTDEPDPPTPPAEAGAECDELGYAGKCMDDVALWADGDTCWVRDCASEGKTCGLISQSEGYGCLEGPQGSTKHACETLGYTGACYGDVLVWADDGSCNYVDCSGQGDSCGWAGDIGYDCL